MTAPPTCGRCPNVIGDPKAGERLPLPSAWNGGKAEPNCPGPSIKAAIPSAGGSPGIDLYVVLQIRCFLHVWFSFILN